MSIRDWVGPVLAILIAAPLSGCASLAPSKAAKREVTGKRDANGKRDVAAQRQAVADPRQRREAAVREFEVRRNQAQYEAAISRWHESDVAGCRQNLAQLLARDPQHVDACLLWAELSLDQQDVDQHHFDEALDRLQACTTRNPKDARVQHMLGLLWEAQGRETEAIACFERAIKLAPDDQVFQASYETATAGFGVAANVTSRSDLNQAVAFDQATRGQPAKRPASVANRSSHSDKNVELVIQRLSIDTTATSSPLATRELLRKASAALDAKDSTQAALWFERAMASEPTNVQIPIQAALEALQHEQTDLAITLVAGQVEQFPRSAPLQLALGSAYYCQADFNSAQSALQQALSLDKRSSLSYFLMGSTHEQLGNFNEAAAHFARAAELDPTLVRR